MGKREHEYDKVLRRLKQSTMFKQLMKKGKGLEEFDWYLTSLKERKSKPHSGCGIGLNRITQFILRSNDIRKATVFPINRATLM